MRKARNGSVVVNVRKVHGGSGVVIGRKLQNGSVVVNDRKLQDGSVVKNGLQLQDGGNGWNNSAGESGRREAVGAQSAAMLEVREVNKSFGKGAGSKEVLRRLSLTVADGEFVALIGPSGSGKTTLFSIIGGLETAAGGEIRIGGKTTTGETGHVAYMPQQASLLPWRTVAGNIELTLTVAGMAKADARAAAGQWLSRVGLGHYADAYPHVLSGGMAQRVSFLRALLSPQRLMLLDEPFGALDALTRLHMQQWLLSIWEENRRSVLLITHSIEEALQLADRIIVLSAAPATVLEEIVVPFGRPRRTELWDDPRFNELKGRIYNLLQRHGNGGQADYEK